MIIGDQSVWISMLGVDADHAQHVAVETRRRVTNACPKIFNRFGLFDSAVYDKKDRKKDFRGGYEGPRPACRTTAPLVGVWPLIHRIVIKIIPTQI